jgi:enoyl-CoA hydratase
MPVTSTVDGAAAIITIDRPQVRNAVDRPTAEALAAAFRQFDANEALAVAILTGAGGYFCAGAGLKAVSSGGGNRTAESGDGPMGPSRMLLSKPVIAAVEGYAVAGGLELACWCDMRVAPSNAVFGLFCRRWGVPLVRWRRHRLPRLIGHSNAMDLILTGRGVSGGEALRMGLANRIAEPGHTLETALELAGSWRLSRSAACALTVSPPMSSGHSTFLAPLRTNIAAAGK